MIPQGHQARNSTYERKDVDVIGIFLVAAIILVLVAISLLTSWGVVHRFNTKRNEHPPAAMAARDAGVFPEPRLEVTPGVALAKDIAAQRVELESSGWVDHKKGIAHIPIYHAMELLWQRGLPDVGAGQTSLQLMQARPQTDQQPNQPVTAPAPSASP